MIEFLLEVLVEFLFEFLLSFFAEVIAQFFGAATAKLVLPDRVKRLNPWFLLPAFACFGIALGIVSIWVFPAHFITAPHLRQANLILTPIFVGICAALGSALSTGGQSQLELFRHAAKGFLFALALTGTRYLMAI